MPIEPNHYLNTIDRLEPDIAMIDPGAYYASAAISLKRIADSLDRLTVQQEYLLTHLSNISENVWRSRE